MRKILLLVPLLGIIVATAKAQNVPPPVPAPSEDTVKPYLKYPKLPAFNIMELDSSTIFNTYNIPKGSATAIVLFDPNCKHCQHTIHDLTANMDSLKHVKFYLVSMVHDMSAIRKFYEEYHLADYKNIVEVGRDYEFFFVSFYHNRSFPAVALYGKDKKFIWFHEGSFTPTMLYNTLYSD